MSCDVETLLSSAPDVFHNAPHTAYIPSYQTRFSDALKSNTRMSLITTTAINGKMQSVIPDELTYRLSIESSDRKCLQLELQISCKFQCV
eukprot:4443899-Amphidinium_carterae.1